MNNYTSPIQGTHRYFIVNKPCPMVSQFVSTHKVPLLGDLDFDFPEGTHAIGRLDNNSEGLLLLTTNKIITRLLFQSSRPHKRTYLVLVAPVVTSETLTQLRNGVSIRARGGEYYLSTPREVELVSQPGFSFPSPFSDTAYYTGSWLKITLTEGKFHQVRKMITAIRHRCQRLVRVSIENLMLGDLQPGRVKELNETDFFELLKLK